MGYYRQITYTGTFNNTGNAYLAIYGWTTSPLVEYYIVESYGEYNPGIGGTKRGSVTTDDGTYDIYTSQRTNAPSIQGTATYPQFWSIRTEKRVGGTVSTKAHFEAWKTFGLSLGTFGYQIVATEGYKSSGESSIDVWVSLFLSLGFVIEGLRTNVCGLVVNRWFTFFWLFLGWVC